MAKSANYSSPYFCLPNGINTLLRCLGFQSETSIPENPPPGSDTRRVLDLNIPGENDGNNASSNGPPTGDIIRVVYLDVPPENEINNPGYEECTANDGGDEPPPVSPDGGPARIPIKEPIIKPIRQGRSGRTT
ncbi:hypothetical protein M9H77_19830 [Catharanthus roseus]|uniref:Uncharacterized protein n=1 Tax=Catharanthus roseus TaxID=4058 RepID=A0ACC0BBG2_CATRO|nr:hypothetical protein M9H77_19830 [Catharanthus roseus]